MTSKTNKYPISQQELLTQKIGLELWQLLTVLTVVFSVASSFMWFGLVNPKNIREKINVVDQKKALVYNQYQEDISTLKSFSIPQSTLDVSTCSVKQIDDNSQNIDKINAEILESKGKVKDEISNINSNVFLTTNNGSLIKTYNSYNDLLNNFQKSIDSIKDFQSKRADLLNNILILCQGNESSMTKQELIDSINDLGLVFLNETITEKIIDLKNSIVSSEIDTPVKLLDQLVAINDIQVNSQTILDAGKSKIGNFEAEIKYIEQWEKEVKNLNPQLSVNTISIYD